mmetsp:Transcript_21420/g.59478  ORF Transcript_21420/g.59478 Transcript_21420/m.59478 type:complete len:237 (+) Transcript_21420:766-1476(+)
MAFPLQRLAPHLSGGPWVLVGDKTLHSQGVLADPDGVRVGQHGHSFLCHPAGVVAQQQRGRHHHPQAKVGPLLACAEAPHHAPALPGDVLPGSAVGHRGRALLHDAIGVHPVQPHHQHVGIVEGPRASIAGKHLLPIHRLHHGLDVAGQAKVLGSGVVPDCKHVPPCSPAVANGRAPAVGGASTPIANAEEDGPPGDLRGSLEGVSHTGIHLLRALLVLLHAAVVQFEVVHTPLCV